MPGITIGDGVIIGAKSIVAKDIPAYGVVAGNPAQLVKYRFASDSINRLLAVSWSDRSAQKV